MQSPEMSSWQSCLLRREKARDDLQEADRNKNQECVKKTEGGELTGGMGRGPALAKA